MNIIIGRENIKGVDQRHVVLELDTIVALPSNIEMPAYCVVENIPIDEMGQVAAMRDLHQNLILEYRKRNWKFCQDAVEHLQGFWNKELDTFYQDLTQRIAQHEQLPPSTDWDWRVPKHML